MLLPQIPKSLFITVMIDDFRFSKCSLNAIFSEHFEHVNVHQIGGLIYEQQ